MITEVSKRIKALYNRTKLKGSLHGSSPKWAILSCGQ
ncbi:hypothetical protein F442_01338 [Phytophthora nicotianae P10297]|uniref:Uncharacterized protein n=1 Tax=Phytophthora nicotianae P10297 TaxID=1317064 RepID=W3A2L2_PHYNI|nr:hypothetical protein F442_01338 [Phytophthora nicotianae P10297]